MSTSNDFSRAAGSRDWAGIAAELNGPGLFAVDGDDPDRKFITNVRRLAGNARTPGSRIIAAGTWLLFGLGAGLLYVSFNAQYHYVLNEKHEHAAAVIEALSPDLAMVILSALGIGLALAGKASTAERFLIVAFAALASWMNYAAADARDWRSVAAYIAPPIVLAIITDRVISVIRRHVLPDDTESAWAWMGKVTVTCLKLAGLVALYVLRTVLAPRETTKGLRKMVLDAAPIPGQAEALPEGLPSAVEFAPHGVVTPHLIAAEDGTLSLCTACPVTSAVVPAFPTKKAAFEWHYRQHPKFGDREALSQVAKELAPLAGIQWGTARLYAAEILNADARAALGADTTQEIAS